ncbi:unnamed protein product, partial [Meganyctiphanes norvegica]
VCDEKTSVDKFGGGLFQNNAGISVTVINIHTSSITMHQVFSTSDYGAHRDLVWSLSQIIPGRLVILASMHDGSLQLKKTTHDFLASYGLSWNKAYAFRDTWIVSFIVGGQILGEALAPNLGLFNSSGSPLTLGARASASFHNASTFG